MTNETVNLVDLLELMARGELGLAWERAQRLSGDLGRLVRRQLESSARLVRTARAAAAECLRLSQALRQRKVAHENLLGESEQAIGSATRRMRSIGHQSLESRRQVDLVEELGREMDRAALNGAIAAARLPDAAEQFVPAFEELRRLTGRVAGPLRELSAFVEGLPDSLGAAGREIDALQPLLLSLDGPAEADEHAQALVRAAQALTASTAAFRVPSDLGTDEAAQLRERLRQQRQALDEEIDRLASSSADDNDLLRLVELLDQALAEARREDT